MRYITLFFLSALLCSCSVKQSVESENTTSEEYTELPAHFIQDELIIKLDPDMRAAVFVTHFDDVGLEFKEAIAEISRLYLFTYDTDKISPHKILEHIRAHASVVQVEFNKRVEQRD